MRGSLRTPKVQLDRSLIRPVQAQPVSEEHDMIRERMKIIPMGEPLSIKPSRFAFVRRIGRTLSFKARRMEGERVARASAVLADPNASADDLRAAFLRVSVALEAEIATSMALSVELAELRREIRMINQQGAQ
ncbi:hypothetical protein C100_14905 [Sphingobium sp. C100]|uniref:hypothetical protein n=1 Tax=Sphingobium sp. C100 TaxID=1207055 RepID=UPI0003D5EBB8|nr:hypothetical protein [Sphingobium sp. C100]ETI63000.1 hypothetical protein C100_14905 [Sphingobium sp. C100]